MTQQKRFYRVEEKMSHKYRFRFQWVRILMSIKCGQISWMHISFQLAMTSTSTKHIVLLGDSIIDNRVYVKRGDPSVINQLEVEAKQRSWKASSLAVDGHCICNIAQQLEKLPQGATHIFISIGFKTKLSFSFGNFLLLFQAEIMFYDTWRKPEKKFKMFNKLWCCSDSFKTILRKFVSVFLSEFRRWFSRFFFFVAIRWNDRISEKTFHSDDGLHDLQSEFHGSWATKTFWNRFGRF